MFLESQLDVLVLISWILLIPVGVLLVIVLFKLAFLLHGASEFMTLARYELYPTLQDVRQIASRVEVLSEKAVHGVETLEKGVELGSQAASEGVDRLKGVSGTLMGGTGTLMGTIARAAWDAMWKKKEKA